MPLSDTAARDIAEVLRKHVDQKILAQIVDVIDPRRSGPS